MFDKEKFRDLKFIKKLELDMKVFRDKSSLLKTNINSKLDITNSQDLKINNSENLSKYNFGLPNYNQNNNNDIIKNKNVKKLK